jgi:hypothetical protein
MPRINDLVDDLAERFAVEPARARNIARYMREAGLLSQGARGVNAPHASFLDASRLLIAMMLIWRRANRIALDVQPILKWQTIDTGRAREQLKFETFEQAIELLFKHNAEKMPPINPINSGRAFVKSVSLVTHSFYSEIRIGRWDEKIEDYDDEIYRFHDPEAINWLQDTSQTLPELPVQKWKSGFFLSPIVYYEDLIAIPHIVAGQQPLGWSPPEFLPSAPPSPEALHEILAARDENRRPLK